MKIKINLNNVQIIVKPYFKTVYQLLNYLYYQVPHFCFNEKLFISGNCRMCLIEVENAPKPIVSCSTPILNNSAINTKTPFVLKARENVLEFLLNNHPLDCPVCDQGGECDLQELNKNFGSGTGRFFFEKSTVPLKKLNKLISTNMNRCINCTKCVRLAFYIGVNNMSLIGRSINAQIYYLKKKIKKNYLFTSIFEICPVGQTLTINDFAYVIYCVGLFFGIQFLLEIPLLSAVVIFYIGLNSSFENFYNLTKLKTVIQISLVFLSGGAHLVIHFSLILIFYGRSILSENSILKGEEMVIGKIIHKAFVSISKITNYNGFIPSPSEFNYVATVLSAAGATNYLTKRHCKEELLGSYNAKLNKANLVGKDDPRFEPLMDEADELFIKREQASGLIIDNVSRGLKAMDGYSFNDEVYDIII